MMLLSWQYDHVLILLHGTKQNSYHDIIVTDQSNTGPMAIIVMMLLLLLLKVAMMMMMMMMMVMIMSVGTG
jgi:hypothetical protein